MLLTILQSASNRKHHLYTVYLHLYNKVHHSHKMPLLKRQATLPLHFKNKFQYKLISATIIRHKM